MPLMRRKGEKEMQSEDLRAPLRTLQGEELADYKSNAAATKGACASGLET
jgi:hypothetical protein